MKQYFEIDLAIPTSDSNLVRDFPTWLRIVGSQGKCVIVLDALNQMDDGSGTEGKGIIIRPDFSANITAIELSRG